MTIGSGANGELTFLDIITLISFYVGLENLDLNITQDDVQNATDRVLSEIHSHLEEQDRKIERILEIYETDTKTIRADRRRDR